MVTYLRMVRSTSASPQNMSYSSSSVNMGISSTGTTAEITFVAFILCRIDESYDGDNDVDDNDDNLHMLMTMVIMIIKMILIMIG